MASRPRRNKSTNPPPLNGAADTAAAPTPPTPPAPPAAPPLPEKKPTRAARASQREDATTRIAVPPPAQKPQPRPPVPRPAPAAKSSPLPKPPPSRKPTRPGSVVPNPPLKPRRRRSPISVAFDNLLDDDGGAADGVSSEKDRAAVQEVFDDLAAEHVEVVRNVMLELEVEDVSSAWIERSKAPLRSLRSMASEMGLDELCAAIDGFCAAIDAALESGQAVVAGTRKSELQGRYKKLIELIPQAFALEGERDRREPIIVESLLRQVPGVEKLTIDKLFAVGLNKLAALVRSNAGDIAATSGIDPELAAQIAGRFHAYREAVPSAVAAQEPAAERAQLKRLLDILKRHHRDYTAAAAGWSDEDRARKREARRLREEAFLQVRVALARLGETQRLAQIEKRPFDQRIAAVERLLEKEEHGRAHP